MAGPALLVHVLVSRYADHLPLYTAHASPVAAEALERIGALYAIEKEVRGSPAEQRRAARQARARPLLDQLHAWFEEQLHRLSRKSDVASAIRYALVRYLDDGRIEIGRVEMWRGRLGLAQPFPALSVAGASVS